MDRSLHEGLPALQRLALSYAPPAARTPTLALLIGALVLPIVRFLALSFFDPGPTLSHCQDLATRPFYTTVMLRTFRTALIVTIGTLILGYPVAFLLASLRGVKATIS